METKQPESFASQAGHWYGLDGTPRYTIIGANGKERATTLRDAKKLGLVPSVTTIIKCASAEGLERWKREQLLLAALTLPRKEGEPEKDWIGRVYLDSQEQGEKAAEKGTLIHGEIEHAYLDRIVSVDYIALPYVLAVKEAVRETFGNPIWRAERSFAHPLGFGGKLDLSAPGIVIDFKTKEFTADKLPEGWDEQCMQLAAYRHGLDMPEARCANVFVSTLVPGLVHVLEWKQEDLARGWEMFKSLLSYWQAKNRHS